MNSGPDTMRGARNLGISAESDVAAEPRLGPVPDQAGFPVERGMPIAWLLPLVLTVLVLAAVVPVVLLGYLGARDNTDRLMRDRSELLLDVVVDRVAAHLDPVRAQLASIAEAVKTGKLDPQDESVMGTYIAGALRACHRSTASP